MACGTGMFQVLHRTLVFFCDLVHDKSEISYFLIFLKGLSINLKTSHLKTKTLR